MGISISDLRPSNAINYNGKLYVILECEHAKLGRGNAFCRVKMKNLKTSQILDCTLRDSDNIEEAFIERRKLQYLYNEEDIYHLLDLATYEDILLSRSSIQDNAVLLRDNLELTGLFYNNKLVNLEFPSALEFKVIKTDPGFRGDTVKGGVKPAKLETGLIVQVPLFVNSGDIVKINTNTRQYLGRA